MIGLFSFYLYFNRMQTTQKVMVVFWSLLEPFLLIAIVLERKILLFVGLILEVVLFSALQTRSIELISEGKQILKEISFCPDDECPDQDECSGARSLLSTSELLHDFYFRSDSMFRCPVCR